MNVWMGALATVALSATLSAQQPLPAVKEGTPAPKVQQANPPQVVGTYTVGQAKPPDVPGSQLRDITLEQAIQIALENNLDLKSARMTPQQQEYTLQAQRAAFWRPSFTGNGNFGGSSTISTNVLDGVGINTKIISKNQGFSTGVSTTLPYFGATASASFGGTRGSTNSVNEKFNPKFGSSLSFNYRMNLLQGFSIDSARNNLKTQAIRIDTTNITLAQTIESTKASVRRLLAAEAGDRGH